MGSFGEVLLRMAINAHLRGPLETYGGPWGPMGTHGDL